MKKKSIILTICIILLIIIIQFSPRLFIKIPGMKAMESENFIFYFDEKDKKAVVDIRDFLEKNIDRINTKLSFESSNKTEIYIYPSQKEFQRRKYGYIVSLLSLDWYIGDNIKDKVLLVSPLNPGNMHNYQSVIETAAHEYVHTVIYRINPKTPLWINEGVVLYLTNWIVNTKLDSFYKVMIFKLSRA